MLLPSCRMLTGRNTESLCIIGASSANMPPKDLLNHAETEEERQELMKQEANLLSVAMTRAKLIVWITYEKTPSPLLERIYIDGHSCEIEAGKDGVTKELLQMTSSL